MRQNTKNSKAAQTDLLKLVLLLVLEGAGWGAEQRRSLVHR